MLQAIALAVGGTKMPVFPDWDKGPLPNLIERAAPRDALAKPWPRGVGTRPALPGGRRAVMMAA